MISKVKTLFTGNHTHIVHVRTGDRHGAGTDANVKIILRDERGRESDECSLNHFFKNDNERGKTSSFGVTTYLDVVHEIQLWRDNFGLGDAWYVDAVEVEHVKCDNVRRVFPIHRWLKANVPYCLRQYDACLPHLSHQPERRKEELEEKRMIYEYTINVPNGPAQGWIKSLPSDEMFSGKYMVMFELLSHKYVTNFSNKLIGLIVDWKTVDDVKKLFTKTTDLRREQPYPIANWHKDRWFGLQRVQGCNPVLIKLCKVIPEKLGVTEEMVAPFLEGSSLQESINANKIFIVDLDILEHLPCGQDRMLCTPIALFYLNKNNDLLPIAIQLFQIKGPDNPVFLPSDPKYTWTLVKMFYNNADATYHQAYTHLVERPMVDRIMKIKPLKKTGEQSKGLCRGLEKLVSTNGWVDRTMTCGRDGMFELIRRGLKVWRLDLNGAAPKEIESRGVSDPAILPHYPYRDDAIAIYDIIRKYITEVVNHYYKTEDDLTNDHELQEWRKELVLSRDKNGVGMLGVPGDENGFTTNEQLIDTVTAIIAVCSIAHASANFQQYDEYAFTPNYPACLVGKIPKDKTPLSETDIISYLPSKSITLDIMVITKMLSMKGTNSLGDFEVQYLYDPVTLDAAERFRKSLNELSDKIAERCKKDPSKAYIWLDPKIVPNAISI
uniref:Lipoxygenase domain-containing protein n=1 Tax=Strigamia maritima TaxID=126957 RepID=T1IPC8_STRMM